MIHLTEKPTELAVRALVDAGGHHRVDGGIVGTLVRDPEGTGIAFGNAPGILEQGYVLRDSLR